VFFFLFIFVRAMFFFVFFFVAFIFFSFVVGREGVLIIVFSLRFVFCVSFFFSGVCRGVFFFWLYTVDV